MKINKYFLSKIIKEEIKSVLYEENLERELIHLFTKYFYYSTNNPTKDKAVTTVLKNKIKTIAPHLTLKDIHGMLDGKVNRELMTFISNLVKKDANIIGHSSNLSYFEKSAAPDEEKDYRIYNQQNPNRSFMIKPKTDFAYDQEDVRKDRKTLIHEEEQVDTREAKSNLYVKMTPQKFLQFAAKDPVSCEERIKRFSIKKYDETGLRGFPSLKINLDNNIIVNHEGRGRSCLAISNNISEFVVALSFVKGNPPKMAISNWENILKRGSIKNQDNTEDIDLSGIRLISEPPDWFRRLRIYAVKYIDKSNKQNPSEEIVYNVNRLTIDTYLKYPNMKEPIEVYKLIPNKNAKSSEPPYDLDSEGRVILKNQNLDDESVWEKIPKEQWDELPAHRI